MLLRRTLVPAALLVGSALALSACGSGTDSSKSPSPTPTPTPSYAVTPAQLHAVAAVGQRMAGPYSSIPLSDDEVSAGFCDDMVKGDPGKRWHSYTKVVKPTPDDPSNWSSGDASTKIGETFNAAMIVDSSAAATKALDKRIHGWASCTPKEGEPYTTAKIDVPGADTSVVRTWVAKKAEPWSAHVASGMARVGNVLLDCTTDARTAKIALDTSMSCLRDMVTAVPIVSGHDIPVTDANRAGVTRTALASVASDRTRLEWELNPEATLPCPTSEATFLPKEAPSLMLSPLEEDEKAKTGGPFGLIEAERLADPAAAKAKVVAARKTFQGCSGTFTRGQNPAQRGKVAGVADESFGDGGFTITAKTKFDPPPPGSNMDLPTKEMTERTSILSVGPYVLLTSGMKAPEIDAVVKRFEKLGGS